MPRCELDGAALSSLDAVYDAVARQLALPPHFGRNLDALWDSLMREVPGPVEIIVRDTAAARRHLGADYRRLEHLLREAAAERSDLTVTFA